eukprot:2182516-Prymnesium_polylepis.1
MSRVPGVRIIWFASCPGDRDKFDSEIASLFSSLHKHANQSRCGYRTYKYVLTVPYGRYEVVNSSLPTTYNFLLPNRTWAELLQSLDNHFTGGPYTF